MGPVTATRGAASEALAVRRRWNGLGAGTERGGLRVGLLASYTVDPLIPPLGVALHDAGVPARPFTGPYNQIAQTCLSDENEFARQNPDVLVVLPRFEELAPETWREDLSMTCEAATAAAERRRACLVFVLPALPEARPYGVFEAARTADGSAAYTAAREQLRARLAGRPNVLIADAEEAVRALGARRVQRPSLYRYAKVPYSDEVFLALAGQLRGLLRHRYAGSPRAAVVDLAGLGPEPAAAVETLRDALLELPRSGRGLAVRGHAAAEGRAAAEATAPELLLEARAVCLDDRPLDVQLSGLARKLGVRTAELALLTADPEAAAVAQRGGAVPCLLPEDDPDRWPEVILAAGVFDAFPDGACAAAGTVDPSNGPDRPAAGAPTGLSLERFIAGLGLNVVFSDAEHAPGGAEAVRGTIVRAHDFTLGTEDGLAVEAAGRGGESDDREIFAGHVTDRLGDYGAAAAVRVAYTASTAAVDVFSISCPAMGRGVEDAVLLELIERADRRGCAELVFEVRDTGRNSVAVEYLRGVAAREWSGPSRRPISLRIADARPAG